MIAHDSEWLLLVRSSKGFEYLLDLIRRHSDPLIFYCHFKKQAVVISRQVDLNCNVALHRELARIG